MDEQKNDSEKEHEKENQEENKEIAHPKEKGIEEEEEEEENLDILSSVVDDFSEVEEIQQTEVFKAVEHIVSDRPNEKVEKKAQKYLEKQKDYSKYELVRTDYPIFLQLPNACGLSSILMLIDPTQNEQIGKILDQIWEHFKLTTVIEQRRKEFQWAYALNYLLLKSATENSISDYIKSLNVEELEHYYIGLESVLRFHQQEHYKVKNNLIVNAYEEYFTKGLVTQWVVSQHIDMFKHNPEIRILMALFGYEFVNQPAPDGTGALFFSDKELKNPELISAKKKIKVLRSEFAKGARIMVGFSFHWVVLTNIYYSKGKIHVSINDPAGKKYNVALQNLTDRDRFYIYRKMKPKPKKLWTQIVKMVEEDGPWEVALAEDIMKTIKERIEIKLEKKSEDKIHLSIAENPEGKTTPLAESFKPIPVKIHDETIETIKREKRQKKSSTTKPEKKSDSEKSDDDTTSKKAFMKKMRKIIGDNINSNNKE